MTLLPSSYNRSFWLKAGAAITLVILGSWTFASTRIAVHPDDPGLSIVFVKAWGLVKDTRPLYWSDQTSRWCYVTVNGQTDCVAGLEDLPAAAGMQASAGGAQ